jgi:hypothetical protein
MFVLLAKATVKAVISSLANQNVISVVPAKSVATVASTNEIVSAISR